MKLRGNLFIGKKSILGLSILIALVVSGCGLKRECDFRKQQKDCKNKSSKQTTKNSKKLYIGE